HRLADAEEQFQLTLRLDSSHAKAAFNLGQTQVLRGRLDDAIPNFKKALQLAPFAVGYTTLGEVLMRLQRHEEAKQAFQAALKLEASDAEARDGLAAAQAQLDKQKR